MIDEFIECYLADLTPKFKFFLARDQSNKGCIRANYSGDIWSEFEREIPLLKTRYLNPLNHNLVNKI